MKKIIFLCMLTLGLGLLGTGCLPPPPHARPRPPAPPGGPSAVMIPHNFGNLGG